MLKPILRYALKRLGLYYQILLGRYGYLHNVGWFRSMESKESVDGTGAPMPWIAYPAYEFLRSRLAEKDMDVLEDGSGNSTLWWASRARSVLACEHDRTWYAALQKQLPGNVELVHVPADDVKRYVECDGRLRKRFDMISIDGLNRAACARHAPNLLTSRGVVLWDDTERYAEGVDYLTHECGFKRIPFIGMKPSVPFGTETSIFYREGNLLGL